MAKFDQIKQISNRKKVFGIYCKHAKNMSYLLSVNVGKKHSLIVDFKTGRRL